jgi:hypothetical protein
VRCTHPGSKRLVEAAVTRQLVINVAARHPLENEEDARLVGEQVIQPHDAVVPAIRVNVLSSWRWLLSDSECTTAAEAGGSRTASC